MDQIFIDWYSELGHLDELAKKKGFEVETGVSVFSVSQEELLNSVAVKKIRKIKLPAIDSMAFDELWSYQYEDVAKFLMNCGIEKTDEWLDRFDGNLSQIVYNAKDKIKALLLATKEGDDTLVHLLIGATKQTEYIMTALKGFANAIDSRGDGGNITVVAARDTVLPLLRRLLDKKYDIDEIGKVHRVSFQEQADEELLKACEEAEQDSAIQNNIGWKVSWVETIESSEI